jgi:small-conductance mechanosensitive channel
LGIDNDVVDKVLFKTIKDNGMYYTTRKRLYYLHSVIILVIFIMLWSESRLDLTIYVGFISAGIAIALKEIFTNIAALLIIIIQKPFEVRLTIDSEWEEAKAQLETIVIQTCAARYFRS